MCANGAASAHWNDFNPMAPTVEKPAAILIIAAWLGEDGFHHRESSGQYHFTYHFTWIAHCHALGEIEQDQPIVYKRCEAWRPL